MKTQHPYKCKTLPKSALTLFLLLPTLLLPVLLNAQECIMANIQTSSASCQQSSNGSATIEVLLSNDVNCECGNALTISCTIINNSIPISQTQDNNGTGSNTFFFPNLKSGTYQLQINTNVGNCSFVTTTFNISQSSSGIQVTSTTNPTDCNATNGSVSFNFTDANFPISLNLNNNDYTINTNSYSVSNLPKGTFAAIFVDINGCTTTVNVTISDKANFSIQLGAIKRPTCSDSKDGEITINSPLIGQSYSVAGISPDMNPGSSNPLVNLTGGITYTLSIRENATGCIATTTATVQSTPEITANANITQVTCTGLNDGSISLEAVSGGNGGYSFQWSNGASTQTVNSLAPGQYAVTIRDSKMCSKTITNLVLSDPASSAVNVLAAESISSGTVATIAVNTGNSNYRFAWKIEEQNNISVSNMPANGTSGNQAGNLNPRLTIQDSRSPGGLALAVWPFLSTNPSCTGDTTTVLILVTPTPGNTPFIPEILTPNGDGVNDEWLIVLPDGAEGGALQIYNRAGGKIYAGNTSERWDGSACPDGVYFYVLTYTLNGTSTTHKGAITLFRVND